MTPSARIFRIIRFIYQLLLPASVRSRIRPGIRRIIADIPAPRTKGLMIVRAIYRAILPLWLRRYSTPWLLTTTAPINTAEIVEPSTAEIVEPSTAEIVDPSTAEIVEPSTAEIVEPSTDEAIEPPPEILKLLVARRLHEAIEAAEALRHTNPAQAARICEHISAIDPYNPEAYVVRIKACKAIGLEAELTVSETAARNSGIDLVANNALPEAVNFFKTLEKHFPATFEPLTLLYSQIDNMTAAYRAMRDTPSSEGGRRRLVICITVWGEKYVDLFTQYFLPSILSPNNMPALSRIRDVIFDLYTTPEYAETIRSAPSFQELSRFVRVNFIMFSNRMVDSPGYRQWPLIRYYIYGGFHHVSIEHARTLDADIICIAPDGVHSDGSFYNYARFIDEGYKAVMFTATRGQAEKLLPILDGLRDEATHSLTLPPRTLVKLAAQHVHHDFQRFILTKENKHVPNVLSILMFPRPDGFYVRCFHLHPIIIAAEALQKDVVFDYLAVDANLIARLFPDPDEWNNIKIIDDTDDGVMVDLSYINPPQDLPVLEFARDILIDQIPIFTPNHFWHFKHRIKYHCDATLEAIGTYDADDDGRLSARAIPVNSVIDIDDEELARWFEENRPSN